MRHRLLPGLVAFAALGWSFATTARADFFVQTNLVSNVKGLAQNFDPDLQNPWGISLSATSPFWVSDQASGKSTLYNSVGTKQGLVVTIPNASPTGPTGPTGQVFNTTNDFLMSNGSKALFIFANLDGSISGWNGGLGTSAQIAVQPSSPASYTGLGLGTSAAGSVLYAADDLNNKIDVFNGSFVKTALSGSFTDPNLPAGFHTFNVQNIGGILYVTYEAGFLQGGVVDAFDLNGKFLHRISANAAGGPLESPWGMAIAPAGFGSFGGKLFVGNEDDGHISIFDPTSGAFLGQVMDKSGNALANTGLWGLTFGNGGNGGAKDTLYFAAGINSEVDGLFGAIRPVPEPGSFALVGLGCVVLAARRLRRRDV